MKTEREAMLEKEIVQLIKLLAKAMRETKAVYKLVDKLSAAQLRVQHLMQKLKDTK